MTPNNEAITKESPSGGGARKEARTPLALPRCLEGTALVIMMKQPAKAMERHVFFVNTARLMRGQPRGPR